MSLPFRSQDEPSGARGILADSSERGRGLRCWTYLGGATRKIVSCSLPLIVESRLRAARPPPCRSCRGAAWWNGWRVVLPVVALSSVGAVERRAVPLPRAKRASCRLGFTCYPPGFYPRRQYQYVVTAEVLGDARDVRAADLAVDASLPRITC